MKKIVLILVGLLLLGATYTGLPIAPTNAVMKGYPSWQYFSVLRLGVNSIGDAPPQWFIPNKIPCTIAGGDTGNQVPSIDGGCFTATPSSARDLREWGINSSNISTPLASAINWAEAGNGEIIVPPGKFIISHGVSITGNNVAIIGPDLAPGNFGFSWPWQSPRITWAAPATDISCQDSTNPCISFSGNALTLEGLEFSNPQPSPPASGTWTPTVWPYIISATGGSWNTLHASQLTFTAADYCINLQGAGNYTAGPQGFNVILRDIYFNGCWNKGLNIQQVDQTIKLDNLEYAYWWGLNNSAVTTYVENNKIDMDLCYAANPQMNDIEFFQSHISVRLTNCTVTSGFGNVTFALNGGQMNNISFNEVCQGMSINGATTVVQFIMNNVIAYGDTTTGCPKALPVFFNFASDQANVGLSNVNAGDVQSLISLGNGVAGDAVLQNISIISYSAFTTGGSAILLSTGAEMKLDATPFNALRPAVGAGPIVGGGASGQGTLYESQVGSCSTGIEGCVIVSAGNNAAGGAMSVLEAGGTRDGYLQAFSSTLNIATDNNTINLNPGGSGGLDIQSVPGVTCSGTPTSSYATKLGITTHC